MVLCHEFNFNLFYLSIIGNAYQYFDLIPSDFCLAGEIGTKKPGLEFFLWVLPSCRLLLPHWLSSILWIVPHTPAFPAAFSWIKSIGAEWSVALDGLSLVLVGLISFAATLCFGGSQKCHC
jgi:hypothetical protein